MPRKRTPKSKALTPLERKDLKQVTRSQLMLDPRSQQVLERVFRLALDEEEEAPAQLQAFALKTVTELMLGTEVDPKQSSEKIQINISGLGVPEPTEKEVFDPHANAQGTDIIIEGLPEVKED